MKTKVLDIPTDEEGYLINPEDWNEEIASRLAQAENLELNDECWSIIGFMRRYFDKHKIAPDVRHVTKHMANELGLERKDAKNRVFALFPYGYVKQACKIAGMKRPRAWSTG